ncbi:zinc finger protein Pegasus isoform X2 [Bubalus kerabau]|uniref:zinc finger protein Pegasus isoform X2 n=1 Tax=Bubalus carabanensis TaxID=3119969 RepID=UPI00244E8AD6|nr:zinc finger protein Pegasus isoform X2 [Bubalus carabanensis]
MLLIPRRRAWGPWAARQHLKARQARASPTHPAPCPYGTPRGTIASLRFFVLLTRELGTAVGREGNWRHNKHGGGGDEDGGGDGDGSGVEEGGGGSSVRLSGAGTDGDQNGLDHPSVEVSLDENSGMLVDGFERTFDGKLKCRYCNYASKGTARLIEHIRIHTGEKPHRCHLCPFASAYERHLEAHMRSHTGEKPYKCELCSFRCSDRSNLSHHRRRKHKMVPIKGTRSSLSSKKMWGVLQKKTSNLNYSRRALINLSPPSMVVQKPDYLNDFTHEIPNIQTDSYESMAKTTPTGGLPRDPQELMVDNPLNQLSTLAGQLSSLPPENQNPASPDVVPCAEEKPFMMQQPSAQAVVSAVSASLPQSSSPASPEPRPPHGQRNYSPVAGPSSEPSAHTSTPSMGNSQPSTPAPTLPVQDPQLLHHCQHCDMYFADNILYTIHMGCHGKGFMATLVWICRMPYP